MQTFTTIIVAFSAINAVSGSPLVVRNTCGSAPGASGSQTPLEQPTDCQTAQACQSACTSNGQCQSFVFGLVDDAIKCMLYAVPAAQVPKQGSQNLIVYDKACGSVPAVTPTSDNPTGINKSGNDNNSQNQNGNNQNSNNQNQNTNSQTSNNQNTNSQEQSNNQDQGQNQQGQQSNPTSGQKLAVRDTCGAAPAGSNSNQAPLSQPSNINSSADCQAQCKANPSCKSFEFGTENNANACRLFSVAASEVPPPSNGQSFQVFDIGCSI